MHYTSEKQQWFDIGTSFFLYLFIFKILQMLKFCTCLPPFNDMPTQNSHLWEFWLSWNIDLIFFFFPKCKKKTSCFCVQVRHAHVHDEFLCPFTFSPWVSIPNADWKTSRYTLYIRAYPALHHCLCLCDLYLIPRIKTTSELWRSKWVILHSPPVGERSVMCNVYPSTFIWKISCLPVTLRLRIRTCQPKSDS